MAAIHETAYPRFKPRLTKHELVELFTLTDDEYQLIQKRTKKNNLVSRLGFAVLLKCFQYLGRSVVISNIGKYITSHVAKQLNISESIGLSSYTYSTYKNHKKSMVLKINYNR